TVTTCAAGMCDAVHKDCAECTSGDLGCSGTTPETCDATGHWSLGTACSGSTPICSAGKCVSGGCTGPVVELDGKHRARWPSVAFLTPSVGVTWTEVRSDALVRDASGVMELVDATTPTKRSGRMELTTTAGASSVGIVSPVHLAAVSTTDFQVVAS